MENIFIYLVCAVLVLLSVVYILKTNKDVRMINKQSEGKWLEYTNNRFEELNRALSDWLLLLELPQFEEEKRREEAAKQLSIVLTEKLFFAQRQKGATQKNE